MISMPTFKLPTILPTLLLQLAMSSRSPALLGFVRYYFPLNGEDLEKMQLAAEHFVGDHDFRNFCSSSPAGRKGPMVWSVLGINGIAAGSVFK